MKKKQKLERATFAAGCFWGVEDAFSKIPGVISTVVGYTGGTRSDPAYQEVCSGETGHAESVEIEYNPSKVKYEELLEAFWGMHNPTSLNRQGPDIGSQYRSAIFYHTPEQKKLAEKSKDDLNKSGKLNNPIVTEIASAKKFWKAEEYHQKYFQKTGRTACHV